MKKWKQVGMVLALSLTVLGVSGCQVKNKDSETTVVEAKKDLLEEVQDRGKLLIGTEGTYAPFTYHDDTGELVGYDVEVGRALAQEMGLEAEFIETNWDACIAGLDAKRYDVVMNQVGITPERLEKYDFSTPYTISRAALIVKSDNNDITTFDDIKGKKSANSFTSNFAKIAEEYGAEIISTDGLFSKAIELVLEGRADATINDEISFYDFMKQKPDSEVKIAATLEEASENAVLIRKGNDSFTKAINEALASLESKGILTEISEKYFGSDISK